jgi:hypothetical protein
VNFDIPNYFCEVFLYSNLMVVKFQLFDGELRGIWHQLVIGGGERLVVNLQDVAQGLGPEGVVGRREDEKSLKRNNIIFIF